MGLKINLHITQKCNYHCRYCFAHFEDHKDLAVEDWKRIIDNISGNSAIDSINFAGGEPVLYQGFAELIAYAWDKGFRLSVISNGSLMQDPALMPPEAFRMLETMGISVDSVDPDTLVKLGACTKNNEVLTREWLFSLIHTAKRHNPSIRIKINTVITNLNIAEDLSAVGSAIKIDRWKLLRMKAFKNEAFCNKDLAVSDDQFKGFVARHRKLSEEVVEENNMARSYVMVDNRGRLLDNIDENYHAIGDLLREDFNDVFSRYHFDKDTYDSRYAHSTTSHHRMPKQFLA